MPFWEMYEFTPLMSIWHKHFEKWQKRINQRFLSIPYFSFSFKKNSSYCFQLSDFLYTSSLKISINQKRSQVSAVRLLNADCACFLNLHGKWLLHCRFFTFFSSYIIESARRKTSEGSLSNELTAHRIDRLLDIAKLLIYLLCAFAAFKRSISKELSSETSLMLKMLAETSSAAGTRKQRTTVKFIFRLIDL